ncbi:MAG: hypothetical protein QOK24_1122 [Verrucomicrobiota bacterium]
MSDGEKCSREESNLHGFPHTVLSRTRLPFRHVSCSRAVAKVRGARAGARIKGRRRSGAAALFAGAFFELVRLAGFA